MVKTKELYRQRRLTHIKNEDVVIMISNDTTFQQSQGDDLQKCTNTMTGPLHNKRALITFLICTKKVLNVLYGANL